eukprot:561326-Rhodomonas_salina.1
MYRGVRSLEQIYSQAICLEPLLRWTTLQVPKLYAVREFLRDDDTVGPSVCAPECHACWL